MNTSFWHACWERNSLGFHQKSIHPFLCQYLAPLIQQNNAINSPESTEASTVFVPLCGKSDDMTWLAEHFDVTGAELSDIACRDFFLEKSIEPKKAKEGDFQKYSYENVALWQGDFFQLSTSQLPNFDWIYDRAAIIALPKEMQQAYAQHLSTFISENTTLFLITLEFPQEELSGPPFAIFENDIAELFKGFNVETIAEHKLEDKTFAQRTFDVSYLKEKLYLISRQ